MSADTAPAAMPGEREISGIIMDEMDDLRVDIHFDIDNKEQVADWAASKIAALFAPILAEKEREKAAALGLVQGHAAIIAALEARALAAEAALAAERERCAQIAYRVCAETRHVTLGGRSAAAIRSGEP